MNISTNESKRAFITKAILIVTLLLSLLQIILSAIALSWDTFYFVLRLLPALITAFLLFSYKSINNGNTYPRQLTLPVVLALVIHIITLLDEIKSLEFYSENAILYNFTTWKYMLLYAFNCGPSVVAIMAMIITGIVCLLKKEKNILSSIFIGIAAVIQLIDGISLLIRGSQIYIQQFGVVYVLFLVVSIFADVLILVSFSVLMFPTKAKDDSLLC